MIYPELDRFYAYMVLRFRRSPHGVPGAVRPQLACNGTAQLTVKAQIGGFLGPLDLLELLVFPPALALFVASGLIVGAVTLTGKHSAVLLITEIGPEGKAVPRPSSPEAGPLNAVFMIARLPLRRHHPGVNMP